MIRKAIPAALFAAALTALWQLVAGRGGIPQYLLPAPSEIARQFISSFPTLVPHLAVTALEATAGFVLGSLVAVALAVMFVHSRTLETTIYPYAIALKSVPTVALAPLFVVWFGSGLLPKILIAAIISFFPIVVNTVRGLRSVDPEAFDLFDSLSASRAQVLLKLRIPSSLPYLFAALRVSSTLAVIGAIVGEFSGADKGLGFFILISSHRLNTLDMFVGILLSSVLGIGVFYAVGCLERLLVPWAAMLSPDAE